jgi:DNA-binding CsgD family transcriptional regulator
MTVFDPVLDRFNRIRSLTPTQAIVVVGYAQGLDSAQIAYAQGWPVKRTNGHGTQALQKLGLGSQEEVADYLR